MNHLLACAAACVMALPMAGAQGAPDSFELAVLRVAGVRPARVDSLTVVLTPLAGAFWCEGLALPECVKSSHLHLRGADTLGLREAAYTAARDLVSRSDSVGGETERRVQAALSSAAPGVRSADPCTAHGTLALTRVGFDASKTVAIVYFRETVGPGPHPGCGWCQTGGTVLRRSPQNEWVVVGSLPGWLT